MSGDLASAPAQPVLYLHGRGDRPDSPPGDLVAANRWGAPLGAPALTDEWLSLPFSELVTQVDGWLERSVLGVGHSFGAWLLLCAAVERIDRGVDLPRLCLLASILGKGFHETSGVGYFAPRARRVRAALGFDRAGAHDGLEERVRFVHAADDDHTSIEDANELRTLGYDVVVVPGGHRLDHPKARIEVAAILRELT